MSVLLKPFVAAVALLVTISAGAPLTHHHGADGNWIIQNVEQGTVLTLDTSFRPGNGMPIGISRCIPGAANQIWKLHGTIVDSYNNTVWTLNLASRPDLYMSTVQTTNASDITPNFLMMQTYDQPQNRPIDGEYGTVFDFGASSEFTLGPVNHPNRFVDWYHFADPSDSFIPLVVNAPTGPSAGEEWLLLEQCPEA